MNQQKIEQTEVVNIVPYINNARVHNDAQVSQIAASIVEFGFNNPILIDEDNTLIAGHGRLLAAKKLKLKTVPTIRLSHLSKAQKKAYRLADNKIALNSDWNQELLKIEIEELTELNFDLSLTGFSEDDMVLLEATEKDTEDDNHGKYTDKTERMTYEPKNEKPSIIDVFDISKFEELKKDIMRAAVPDDERLFLLAAAYRHVKFNYQLIADYYAHSNEEMQALMEQSALVIVDIRDAIANGYIKLQQKLSELYEQEHGDED